MVREVKFKAQRCFEGQWEVLLMMGGCRDATLDCREPEISSSAHPLQFSDVKETLCCLSFVPCTFPLTEIQEEIIVLISLEERGCSALLKVWVFGFKTNLFEENMESCYFNGLILYLQIKCFVCLYSYFALSLLKPHRKLLMYIYIHLLHTEGL